MEIKALTQENIQLKWTIIQLQSKLLKIEEEVFFRDYPAETDKNVSQEVK